MACVAGAQRLCTWTAGALQPRDNGLVYTCHPNSLVSPWPRQTLHGVVSTCSWTIRDSCRLGHGESVLQGSWAGWAQGEGYDMLPLAAGATRREEGAATVIAKGAAFTSLLRGSTYSYARARPPTCMSAHISLTVHSGDGRDLTDVETKV